MNKTSTRLVNRYPDLLPCAQDIECAFGLLKATFRAGGKLLVCGNGGSAADSEHIVGELMKGFNSKRVLPDAFRRRLIKAFPGQGEYLAANLQGALPALSLVSQTSLLSAFANDVAPDMALAQQVYGYGAPGDALIAISTSGTSKNVLNALRVARVARLKTIGLTGGRGGGMAPLCDALICVPGETTSDIQERHQAVYHALCAMLEEEFFRPPGQQ